MALGKTFLNDKALGRSVIHKNLGFFKYWIYFKRQEY